MKLHALLASAFADVAAVFAVSMSSTPIDLRGDENEGRRVFRFETFGDEKFWTDEARLHEVIADSLSPKMALELGLKVDAEALPAEVARGIKDGSIDLSDPATTIALLGFDAGHPCSELTRLGDAAAPGAPRLPAQIDHAPAETGMNGDYAERTVNKAYRTTPLRGLWQHPPYFHDGSAETLQDVVAHYDRVFELRLTEQQRADLVEFLKAI